MRTRSLRRVHRLARHGTEAAGTKGPSGTVPSLRTLPAGGNTRTVVLVLHGGQARSTNPVQPWQLAYLRMIPFTYAAHSVAAQSGTAVWLLRNRLRGWNEPQRAPVDDARWALTELRRAHPAANIVLIGHSMGGRTALRLAGDEGVVAVCALAPWIEQEEPVRQLAGKPVLIAHGDRDRRTSPRASAEYVQRASHSCADIRFVTVPSSGHAMLRRSGLWTALVRDFVRDAVPTGRLQRKS
ncbi:dienelactone hydrolase [Halopolyspora algeriensis]|uniref:Dienelactone hydrolase n=1 Tax=Halopolyspora algeriensis TaxID=1500506 RepID=A0A368VDC1_9ACTN|nr:alpha/beta fold hydrolase [Halopolyspora algeriensis]RCW39112.1 dienelactone hydrolase [Halopolyspora algeriensis]TQM56590.1 dienelactone hydrolase [Halopolyspora algeriensis]